MTLIRRTNPLGELISWRQAVDRLFEDSFLRPLAGRARQITITSRGGG